MAGTVIFMLTVLWQCLWHVVVVVFGLCGMSCLSLKIVFIMPTERVTRMSCMTFCCCKIEQCLSNSLQQFFTVFLVADAVAIAVVLAKDEMQSP